MKSLLDTSIVVTIAPAASTCAPLPKLTPLGLEKMTCPLAFTAPSICDGLVPVMRFKVTALELG